MRRRLDAELVRRGLVVSRSQAAELIGRGLVLVGGAVADKPARLVAEGDSVEVESPSRRFVSRGGEKLDAALETFAVSVEGRRCLDLGASTGGFTECLLRRGARQVVAVDVAHGMIHPSLREDPRVVLLERTNVRHLDRAGCGGDAFDVVVADLSFISLVTVMDVIATELPAPGADLVLLVKPQFEVGRRVASKGRGVVKDPHDRRDALERVASALLSHGAGIMGAMASPLLGPAGNAEFLLHARALVFPEHRAPESVAAILDAAVAASPDASTWSR